MSTTVEPLIANVGRGVLVWGFDIAVQAISSASVNGGAGRIDWIVNIGVSRDYSRTDLDDHAAEMASALGLAGRGTALFTAVDVRQVRRVDCAGAVVHATVGVSRPTWAAGNDPPETAPVPGTINIVAQLPVRMDPGAAVNAVMTVTEAKAQALIECGVAGTGTASDAVVIVWPAAAAAERFGGSRSVWGRRLALAAHEAIHAGLRQRDT